MLGTWTSSLHSDQRTRRVPRGHRKARTPRDSHLSVWQGLQSCFRSGNCDPNDSCDHRQDTTMPTIRQACTRPADYKQPLCRWCRPPTPITPTSVSLVVVQIFVSDCEWWESEALSVTI
ncbi:hypothetical protein TcCL_Unassigned04392, partial [Trypanosoma cruzi]